MEKHIPQKHEVHPAGVGGCLLRAVWQYQQWGLSIDSTRGLALQWSVTPGPRG